MLWQNGLFIMLLEKKMNKVEQNFKIKGKLNAPSLLDFRKPKNLWDSLCSEINHNIEHATARLTAGCFWHTTNGGALPN